LKKFNNIWLINIGETLPINGNKPMRMGTWKLFLENSGYNVLFFTTDFEHQRKIWINEYPHNYVGLNSILSYKKNIGIRRLLNHFFITCSFLFRANKYKKKPDLILVSYPTILLSFAAVWFSKKNNIKIIVDVRDKWPDIFIQQKKLQWVLYPLVAMKNYIFRNSQVISISPNYFNWALNCKYSSESKIIPLSNNNKPISINRVLNPNQTTVFIFVGTLGSTYSLDSIYNLHDLLMEKDINFIIEVCGDGPEKSTFIEKIKTRKNIYYNGWTNEIKLDYLLKTAHFGLMFYHPNSPQGWPNKLIEYMSNGLPIINTLKGESWDLIEKKYLGLNIEINDLNKVASFISLLQNSKDQYDKIVDNCKNEFKNNFSVEIIHNKLLNIIENE
jgi:glycosyltransferase involved in cell wall biosynthesis